MHLLWPHLNELMQGTETKSINFYEKNASNLVSKAIKLTTIRRDSEKYRNFNVYDKVEGNFNEENIDLYIWGIQKSVRLGEIDPILLALDGFLNTNQAVEDLRRYPGYENINENTPVTLIGILDKQHVPSPLLSLMQFSLLTSQHRGESLSNVVRKPDLQKLFKPAIANWFYLGGNNVEDWLNFYKNNNLIEESEFNKILDYEKYGRPNYFRRRVFNNPKTTKYLFTRCFHDGSGYLPADRDYCNLYLPFVLGDLSRTSIVNTD